MPQHPLPLVLVVFYISRNPMLCLRSTRGVVICIASMQVAKLSAAASERRSNKAEGSLMQPDEGAACVALMLTRSTNVTVRELVLLPNVVSL